MALIIPLFPINGRLDLSAHIFAAYVLLYMTVLVCKFNLSSIPWNHKCFILFWWERDREMETEMMMIT